MNLAGLITVRNGNSLDYCWREAALSLLGVCDELVLHDVSSDDGTWQEIQSCAVMEPKITPLRSEWTDPQGDIYWWPKTLNLARDAAHCKMVIHLDADEILHEDDYPKIRAAAEQGRTLYLHRLNFWKDSRNLIPVGQCCGTRVLRMCPRHMHLPSDYPYAPSESTEKLAEISAIRIFHYGFLRKREAFFAKTRAVQRIWANDYDVRLEAAEKDPQAWATNPCVSNWVNDLIPYEGSHPEIIKDWLKERGV